MKKLILLLTIPFFVWACNKEAPAPDADKEAPKDSAAPAPSNGDAPKESNMQQ